MLRTGLLYCFSFLLLIQSVSAADPTKHYQVELIIFEQDSKNGWTEERWTEFPGIVDYSNSFDLNRLTTDLTLKATDLLSSPIEVLSENHLEGELLPPAFLEFIKTGVQSQSILNPLNIQPEESELAEDQHRIQRAGYRILFSNTWRQSAVSTNGKSKTRFHASKPDVAVAGTFRLVKTKFEHAYLDVEFIRFIPSDLRQKFADFHKFDELSMPEHWIFHLSEHRKIKLGKLNYIDHPIFGILLKVSEAKPSNFQSIDLQ
jgi:hypothetical protein